MPARITPRTSITPTSRPRGRINLELYYELQEMGLEDQADAILEKQITDAEVMRQLVRLRDEYKAIETDSTDREAEQEGRPPAGTAAGLTETEVEGLTVTEPLPEDIEAITNLFDDYTIRGTEAIPIAAIERAPLDEFEGEDLEARIDALAEQIMISGRITPVVVGEYGGMYQLIEGAHRVEALERMGKTMIPAVVAVEVSPEGDLLGDDTRAAQELADEIRRRDEARQAGQESIETGDPGDMFSAARQQQDLVDEAAAAPDGVDDAILRSIRDRSIEREELEYQLNDAQLATVFELIDGNATKLRGPALLNAIMDRLHGLELYVDQIGQDWTAKDLKEVLRLMGQKRSGAKHALETRARDYYLNMVDRIDDHFIDGPTSIEEEAGKYGVRVPWKTSRRGEGDLYIQRVGKNAGVVSRERTSDNDLAISVDQSMLMPDYVFYVLQSLETQLRRRQSGGVIHTITKHDVDQVLYAHFSQQARDPGPDDADGLLDEILQTFDPVETQADAPRLDEALADAADSLASLRSTPTKLSKQAAKELAAGRRVSLVGETINNQLDLATLAQRYRDPRMETLRAIFTNDDNLVIAQVGLTQRLPAAAAGLVGNDMSAYLLQLSENARRVGATKFWMQHNHPSGRSNASNMDLRLTHFYRSTMAALAFQGHVIVDRNEYTLINSGGNEMKVPFDTGAEPEFTGGIAGAVITSPGSVANLFREIALDEDSVVLVQLTHRHIVQGISTLPVADIGEAAQNRRLLQRAALAGKASRLIAVGRDRDALLALQGNVFDAILIDDAGFYVSLKAAGMMIGDDIDLWPADREARVSPDTTPPFDYLRRESLRHRLAGQGTNRNFSIRGVQESHPLNDELQATAQAIQEKYGLKTLSVGFNGAGDLQVYFITVPEDLRRRGAGSAAMRELVRFADEKGLTMYLELALTDDMEPRPGLIDFYTKAGFEPWMEGFTDAMIREPTVERPAVEPAAPKPAGKQPRIIRWELGPTKLTDRRADERQGEDRRSDPELRAKIAGMSIDDKIDALFTDELTGLLNLRAFNEDAKTAKAFASIDVDSLKAINDNLGMDAGDAMLIAVGRVLNALPVDAYRTGGDEFFLLGQNPQALMDAVMQAQSTLAQQVIETSLGKLPGIQITAGIGTDKPSADARMKLAKKDRELRGDRAARGGIPDRMVLNMQTVNAEPGTNYVGMIGKHSDLPISPNHEYVLGTGETVKIPKQPVRRAQIIKTLERAFGVNIYQGRVHGATRLGFYRPGIGAIRTKFHNDLEVTAHELSHWFDDHYPWIRRLYHERQFSGELKGVSYDTDKVYEGYAEFMRLWFTQDYQARQVAPTFYDAFMNELKGHPKLEKTLLELQNQIHAWYLQGARARLAGKIGKDKLSLRQRLDGVAHRASDYFLRKTFDYLRPFKQAELAIRGVVANASNSGYKALRLAHGAYGVWQAIYHRGTINWNEAGDLVFTGKGLKQIFAPVDTKLPEFQLYMFARRGRELMQQGRENLARPDEISAGLLLGQQNPEFAEVFDEWLAFNQRMMDFYQASGILSADSRRAIEALNKNYVPFNRVMDIMQGQRVKQGGSPFMRLTGGTQNVNDIFENITGNVAHLTHLALVNQGKANFYRMIDAQAGNLGDEGANQMAGQWAVGIPKEVGRTHVHKDEVLRAVLESAGVTMSWYNSVKNGFLSSDTEEGQEAEIALFKLINDMELGMAEMIGFWQFGQDPRGPNLDFYLEGGDKKFYEIADAGLMEAINLIGPQAHNLAVNILGGFANLLRRGITLTPTFQVKNFIRDTMNAFTLSRGKIVPAVAATKALLERLYNDEHYWEYMLNGGGFASMAQADGINADRIIDNPQALWQMYDSALSAFEYANRIAEFKTVRKKGATAREAAFLGREISTDFAMRGASQALRVLTISIPFMNARMQGLYRNGREIFSMQKGQLGFAGGQAFSYALRSLISITIPTLVLYAYNKDDERYKEMPDWIKDLSWVFFTGPGEDEYVMVPKPFETGMIWGTLPERMIGYFYDHDEEELADAMLWMMIETFALDIIPQAVKPIDELRRNQKWTGAPIIPEYLEGVSPPEQYRAYTSDSMIALGRKWNMSPLKAEHIVRGYLGTLGGWALGAADYMVGDLSQGGERPTRSWRENFLMSPFVDDGPLRRTDSEDRLYKMLRETREVVATVNLMYKRSPQRLEEYVTEPRRTVLKALNDKLGAAAKRMREIQHAIDRIEASPDLTGDQKREAIFELRRAKNEISRSVVDAINPNMIDEVAADVRDSQRRAVGGN